MEKRLLLLGDEAIAQAALDAGISGVYAYPGTPSTEITEYVQTVQRECNTGVHCDWSSNEKTAMEAGLGMSYAGKRAMVCMKHVGLNVAADAFVNAAITGVNGGLVVVVADDPSMHSSQNEQDSRYYGGFAHIPVIEPSSQQEAYDMIFEAFDISEEFNVPVLMRITTRLAHSRADVRRRKTLPQRERSYPTDDTQFVLLPSNARRNYSALLAKEPSLIAYSEAAAVFIDGANRKTGIIAAGIAVNYVHECFREQVSSCPVLQISHYPLPRKQIRELCAACDEVLVAEEGAPLIEELLIGVLPNGVKIRGRLDGSLPRTGELTPDEIASALGMPGVDEDAAHEHIRGRPPQLCKGCSHIDSFNFINECLKGHSEARVFSDIGCYTLGALPPFSAIHSCVDMGASLTMAKGAADAGVHPSLAVIGDSTFTHSGITGLLDIVYENTDVVILILDNEITAMTGGQESLATGRLEQIVAGIGVPAEHIRVVNPLAKHHAENLAVLADEIAHKGVSVIIPRRACIHNKRRV